jgi:hypothetical protein
LETENRTDTTEHGKINMTFSHCTKEYMNRGEYNEEVLTG